MSAAKAAVKVRPVTMTEQEVWAILEGRRTQFRRAVNPQPSGGFTSFGDLPTCDCHPYGFHDGVRHFACPYGPPGTRLWLREPWAPRSDVDPKAEPEKALQYLLYEADGSDHPASGLHWHDYGNRWRPASRMPRWASRITPEVTGVRVERLQTITEADALADGGWAYGNCPFHKSPEKSFMHQWDATYGKRRGHAWADNPWVWVVAFRQLFPEGGGV